MLETRITLFFETDTDGKDIDAKEELLQEALRRTVDNVLKSNFKDDKAVKLVFSAVG